MAFEAEKSPGHGMLTGSDREPIHGVARRFVADLNKRRVAITAARPEDIDRYLQQVPWTHPLRPGGLVLLRP